MQSFISPPEIVQETNESDHHNHRQSTHTVLYTCIKAVIKLIYEVNKIIEAGVIRTRLPDTHLDMASDGRTRSKYFTDRSITHSFTSILIAPRLFPQKIVKIKVLKTRPTPYIALMITTYREDEQTLINSFSSPIFITLTPAKSDACIAACDYITMTSMAKLELLNDSTLMVDNESDGNQSDDEDPNVKNMSDQPSIDGIPEGEPSAIKGGLSNIEEDMTGTYHSKINQDDVNLLSSLQDISNDNRKRCFHTDHKNSFKKAHYSHILPKRPQGNIIRNLEVN